LTTHGRRLTTAILEFLGASACLAALLPAAAGAQSVALVPYGGQNFNQPFHVAAPPGDGSRVMVVEAGGTIRLVKDGVTQGAPFLNINADVFDISEGGCECGMFSMAFAPDYSSSGLFYVFYTRDSTVGGEQHYLRIEEFRRSASNPDLADPATRRIVLEIPHLSASNHNGGQLQFGPDGLLYISVGDGGNTPANAQLLNTRLGKLLRIDPRGPAPFNYSIPAGNPFADGAGPNADEIYSYGLRNPYRSSFDRSTGDLTIGDVGGGSWEEIDFMSEGTGRGANFGWVCFEGFAPTGQCGTAPANHQPPVFQYARAPSPSAAINGGFVIRDPALPTLAGRYIYTDSSGALGGELRTITLGPGFAANDAGTGIVAAGTVSFGQDACGHIYVAQIGGPVSRLQPTTGAFPCKLAPVLKVKTKSAKRAAKKGAIVLKVECDEDCDAVGDGFIRVQGAKKKLKADADSSRVQIGDTVKLKLDLSKGQTRRLRKALAAGRRAKAKIEVSATGGGGGTDTVKRKVKQT